MSRTRTKLHRGQKRTPETEAFIGRSGFMLVEGLRVKVKVVDARTHFGRIDLQVTSTHGGEPQWVSVDRVEFGQ